MTAKQVCIDAEYGKHLASRLRFQCAYAVLMADAQRTDDYGSDIMVIMARLVEQAALSLEKGMQESETEDIAQKCWPAHREPRVEHARAYIASEYKRWNRELSLAMSFELLVRHLAWEPGDEALRNPPTAEEIADLFASGVDDPARRQLMRRVQDMDITEAELAEKIEWWRETRDQEKYQEGSGPA